MKPINLKKVIEDTVYATVLAMKKEGMLREDLDKKSTEKVEDLLKAYPTFKEVKDKHVTERMCVEVEKALAKIKGDKYYDVIEMYYFDEQPVESIATRIGCSISTASRNKTRLINELAIQLFSDEVIRENWT